MTRATHNDIVRLFPGIQDHTALEIIAMQATINELEAASQLLQDNDDGLIEVKRRKGDRLNLLCGLLAQSEIQLRDEP
ncbi:MAG: hypothetical protein OEY74_11860 [Gammaproteobacteria bacterium]|nr:hypothetical protein [Gammaproteobacteria bacterium]